MALAAIIKLVIRRLGKAMGINIGDNNKISKSVISERSKVTPAEGNGIARELIIGIVVTVIGGILLTVILTIFGFSNP